MPFPSRKGAGDEPIVLSFFIQDAEVGAWHRYENLVVQDLEDNFRSPKQFHAYFAHIGMDQTRMIFSLDLVGPRPFGALCVARPISARWRHC